MRDPDWRRDLDARRGAPGSAAAEDERDEARAEIERLRSEHVGIQSYVDALAAERAEAARVREALQAEETRVEYGRQIGEDWMPEHRGIKYATHQRTVHFRVDEPVPIDHWTYTDHRHPVEGCTHPRHDLTTQAAVDARLSGESNG